jgi:O-antigen ligase
MTVKLTGHSTINRLYDDGYCERDEVKKQRLINAKFLPVIILGIYAADLHKYLIYIVPLAWGQPRQLDGYVRLVDIIFAGTVIFFLGFFLMRKPAKTREFFRLTALSQFILLAILSLSLVNHYEPFALDYYLRFIGGNLLLLLAPLIICSKPRHIVLLWTIWILLTLILALVGTWFWSQRLLWSSVRSVFVPGVGIRLGYWPAISILYLLYGPTTSSRLFQLFRAGFIMVLLFGILTSGTRMGFIGLASIIIIVDTVNILARKKIRVKSVVIFIFIFAFLIYIFSSKNIGFVAQLFQQEAYEDNITKRMEMYTHYFDEVLRNPLLGSGIRAIYSGESNIRIGKPHGTILSLLIQTGFLGVVSYLFFFLILCRLGWMLLQKKLWDGSAKSLVFATYLALIYLFMKGLVAGDVPGNRELWFFAGMLLTCHRFATYSVKEKVNS